MSAAGEFPRPVRLDSLGAAEQALAITADDGERAALARRFGLIGIDSLEADATLRREGVAVLVRGRLRARATQSCVVTGAPVAAPIDEPFTLRFVPEEVVRSAEEIELDADDLDVIAYTGGAIDLGEAVAQGFALALDPFPRAADADAQLRAAGILTEEEAEAARQDASPFAALKGFKRD